MYSTQCYEKKRRFVADRNIPVEFEYEVDCKGDKLYLFNDENICDESYYFDKVLSSRTIEGKRLRLAYDGNRLFGGFECKSGWTFGMKNAIVPKGTTFYADDYGEGFIYAEHIIVFRNRLRYWLYRFFGKITLVK